jgi:hypothetical protein
LPPPPPPPDAEAVDTVRRLLEELLT